MAVMKALSGQTPSNWVGLRSLPVVQSNVPEAYKIVRPMARVEPRGKRLIARAMHDLRQKNGLPLFDGMLSLRS
jgi:hypothetical protein